MDWVGWDGYLLGPTLRAPYGANKNKKSVVYIAATMLNFFFNEKHRHAPTYLGEVAFMQTGVTLCNVAIFLEVGSIISRIDSI